MECLHGWWLLDQVQSVTLFDSCALQVAAALERVLADVKPLMPAPAVWSLEQQQQEAAFNTANASLQPAVYYSPDAYQALIALYADLLQAVAAGAPAPPEVKKGWSAS